MRVFANHIGFDKTDDKTAVLELEKEAAELTAWLEADDGERYDVSVSGPERIPDWSEAAITFWTFPMSGGKARTGLPEMPTGRHSGQRSFRSPDIF